MDIQTCMGMSTELLAMLTYTHATHTCFGVRNFVGSVAHRSFDLSIALQCPTAINCAVPASDNQERRSDSCFVILQHVRKKAMASDSSLVCFMLGPRWGSHNVSHDLSLAMRRIPHMC